MAPQDYYQSLTDQPGGPGANGDLNWWGQNAPQTGQGGNMNAYQQGPDGRPLHGADPTWNVAPTPAQNGDSGLVASDSRYPPGGGFAFGQAPASYSSTPWTGGAAPTYAGPSGGAPTFTAPTDITEQNDPGYAARLAAGNQSLNRGFAASGNLLSGGTLKALARYNQDYASNEFQNVYNRAQGDFSAQNTTFGNNQTAAQNTFNAANTNYQNRYATYLGDNARTLSDYTTNIATQRNAQNDYWSQLLGLSTAGQNAASQGQGA